MAHTGLGTGEHRVVTASVHTFAAFLSGEGNGGTFSYRRSVIQEAVAYRNLAVWQVMTETRLAEAKVLVRVSP